MSDANEFFRKKKVLFRLMFVSKLEHVNVMMDGISMIVYVFLLLFFFFLFYFKTNYIKLSNNLQFNNLVTWL